MTGDDTSKPAAKTLGQAIDAIIEALRDLDGPTRTSAIRAACDHLSLTVPLSAERRPAPVAAESAGAGVARPATDIRSLKEARQPSSASEMAAVVAYYLQEAAGPDERKTEVDVSDMEKYFKQAGYPLPKAPRQLLFNAKKAGYFDATGDGKFKLNPVGYNLVAHNLPRRGEVPERRRVKRAGKATRGGRQSR